MTQFNVGEGTTQRYTAVIKDELGAAIPGTQLTTLTLTLYAEHTGAIVNGRDAQNVLNANNVTVDANGILVWLLQPADNAILDGGRAYERHIALFQWTYASGAKSGQQQVNFFIPNTSNV